MAAYIGLAGPGHSFSGPEAVAESAVCFFRRELVKGVQHRWPCGGGGGVYSHLLVKRF